MNKSVFLVAILLCTGTARAQNHVVDSLQMVLQSATDDTNKVNTLNELALQLVLHDKFDNSLRAANEAYHIAKKINFPMGMIVANRRIAVAFRMQNNGVEALKYSNEALKLAEKTGDRKSIAMGYIGIAWANVSLENYPEALENSYTALKIFESIKDKAHIAEAQGCIALVYQYQENYTESLTAALAALKIKEELHDTIALATAHTGVGWTYMMLVNYNQAMKEYSTGLSLYEAMGSDAPQWAKPFCYSSLADLYHKLAEKATAAGDTTLAKNMYTETLKYELNAIKLWESIGHKNGEAYSSLEIGNVYLQLKDLGKAKYFLIKGMQFADDVAVKGYQQQGYLYLSTLDSLKGDYKPAYEHYRSYIALRDTLLNQEKAQKSNRVKMNYEFDKKETIAKAEQDKKDIRQRNIRNSILGALSIMMVFSIVVYRQRNKISSEKKRSEELLLNILPYEVAEELKEKGTAGAKHFDDVTVLFTDFKSFTTVSERLTPQQLVDELHACFSAFDKIMEKYGIEKIKTVGDAYLAVCGLPLANPNHAENLVNAAIEIRDFMLSRRKDLGEQTFEIRIGIHSGSVVAGIVGVKKFAYDIWGDTVNTAARMEQNSEAGKINISQSTYELVKDKFSCEYRGEIEAKNKGKLKMYFINND